MIVFLSHPADASSNDQFSRTAWCGDANPDPSWESNLPFSIPNIFQTIADKSLSDWSAEIEILLIYAFVPRPIPVITIRTEK